MATNHKSVDFAKAAVTVLKKSRRPLSVREIAEEMVKLGLVERVGKTPQNSMQNTIRRANEKRRESGAAPLFTRTQRDGDGRFLYSVKE